MGKFYNTPACVSDAAGYNVDFDTEYMYRCDGLRLNVIRFEYYKSDDADYNWFVLAPIDCNNDIRANFIGYDARTSLRIILVHLRGDLYDVFEKIEDINA